MGWLEMSGRGGRDGRVKDEVLVDERKRESIMEELKRRGCGRGVVLIADRKDEV